MTQPVQFTKLNQIVEKAAEYRDAQGEGVRDQVVSLIYNEAEKLACDVVTRPNQRTDWDRKIDNIITSRIFGYPLMLALLGAVFWITISGANVPSQMLANLLFGIEDWLSSLFIRAGAPDWLHGLVVLGTYRGLAWVVSVMLPPMAIFFPIFTLLEDLGYLPRVAFNLDHAFKKVGAHGKQALTMSMGFGCNAAGVIAARIIDSPRERLIAILTNNFVPCNGRFPSLIAISMIFLAGGVFSAFGTLAASALVVGMILVGISVTLAVSWLLSRTLLQGEPSSFTLELPPYRKPQIIPVIIRSLLDRTAFVLARAVIIAAPAGALTWVFANIYIGDLSIVGHVAGWLDPFGRAIGLDGMIILAFILGLPANEIVVPIMVMGYLSAGSLLEFDSLIAFRQLLLAQNWTLLTALNFMLFSILHFPCGTTLLTIRKETGSIKWTVLAAVIPTIIAILVCFSITQGVRLLNLL
ncbi:MAG: nucleoside recognition domain-containing protein [Bacillota bacterium]|nr:nucleoside recognition domain-containing protein [Bacillota bacterium]MDW7683744.1 nucleoside recognition domain-containing protein [Bacillota bacterium]